MIDLTEIMVYFIDNRTKHQDDRVQKNETN